MTLVFAKVGQIDQFFFGSAVVSNKETNFTFETAIIE